MKWKEAIGIVIKYPVPSYTFLVILVFFFAIRLSSPTPNSEEVVEAETVEPQSIRLVEATVMKVTAYCPCKECCGRYTDGFTASNYQIEKGDRFVAADKGIPFGTMLVVPGYNNGKPVPVLDRGKAIVKDRLDVFFDTHQEALDWGVKWLVIKDFSFPPP